MRLPKILFAMLFLALFVIFDITSVYAQRTTSIPVDATGATIYNIFGDVQSWTFGRDTQAWGYIRPENVDFGNLIDANDLFIPLGDRNGMAPLSQLKDSSGNLIPPEYIIATLYEHELDYPNFNTRAIPGQDPAQPPPEKHEFITINASNATAYDIFGEIQPWTYGRFAQAHGYIRPENVDFGHLIAPNDLFIPLDDRTGMVPLSQIDNGMGQPISREYIIATLYEHEIDYDNWNTRVMSEQDSVMDIEPTPIPTNEPVTTLEPPEFDTDIRTLPNIYDMPFDDEGYVLSVPPADWLVEITAENFAQAQVISTLQGTQPFSVALNDDGTILRLSYQQGRYAEGKSVSILQNLTNGERLTIPFSGLLNPSFNRIIYWNSYPFIELMALYDTVTGEPITLLYDGERGSIQSFTEDDILYINPQKPVCSNPNNPNTCNRQWTVWDMNSGSLLDRYSNNLPGLRGNGTKIPSMDKFAAVSCTARDAEYYCIEESFSIFNFRDGEPELYIAGMNEDYHTWFNPIDPMTLFVLKDGIVQTINLDTLQIETSELQLPDEDYFTFRFSPDGSILATGTKDGYVILFETENYTEIARWKEYSSIIINLTFNYDGTLLAAGGGFSVIPGTPYFNPNPSDSIVRVWNVETGDLLHSYRTRPTAVNSVVFTPDNTLMFVASGNGSSNDGGEVAVIGILNDEMLCSVTANVNVNRRAGPGTGFAVVGSMAAGDTAYVIGQDIDGEGYVWYQLIDDSWARSDMVAAADNCATVLD